MSECEMKLEALLEYREALRYRQLYEEMYNSLLGLLNQMVRYHESNGLRLPEDIVGMADRVSTLAESRAMEGHKPLKLT
jgi:hypothetical protein